MKFEITCLGLFLIIFSSILKADCPNFSYPDSIPFGTKIGKVDSLFKSNGIESHIDTYGPPIPDIWRGSGSLKEKYSEGYEGIGFDAFLYNECSIRMSIKCDSYELRLWFFINAVNDTILFMVEKEFYKSITKKEEEVREFFNGIVSNINKKAGFEGKIEESFVYGMPACVMSTWSGKTMTAHLKICMSLTYYFFVLDNQIWAEYLRNVRTIVEEEKKKSLNKAIDDL